MFNVIETLFLKLFKKFGNKKFFMKNFRIAFEDALLKYGTDKPDFAEILEISDLTHIFKEMMSNLKYFKN